MSTDASPPPITRLYRSCEPLESLRPEDPRWIDFDAVRGEENVVALYARSLRRALPDRPDFKLFAGHRGVGKTSELHRLKGLLESEAEGSRGFVVVMCDAASRLDVNDLDFPDLLVDTGFVKLAAELRNRPGARRELRDAIEAHSTSLLDAVNDLLDGANASTAGAGLLGIVLIIDGLDKLVRRDLEGGGNTHDRLFIDRSEQLASLRAHVVYTVPISLIYSARFGQLQQSVGEHNTPISMVRLRPRRAEAVDADSAGMRKMREMVHERCRHANVAPEAAFDEPATLDRLCELSGGHPRHLMMFLQSACNELDELPITGAVADKAIRKYANALSREVPDEAWDALQAFDEPRADIPKDDLHQLMLLMLFVFKYVNGEPWYEVNPVLRTVGRFGR